MHRTQMYIDDALWETLKLTARIEKTTVSDLLRTAAREKYTMPQEGRVAAMQAFVGLRKDRPEFDDVDAYIRNLRRGDRRRKMLAG